jgi:hypothetical protein
MRASARLISSLAPVVASIGDQCAFLAASTPLAAPSLDIMLSRLPSMNASSGRAAGAAAEVAAPRGALHAPLPTAQPKVGPWPGGNRPKRQSSRKQRGPPPTARGLRAARA